MLNYGYDPQLSEGAVKSPVFLTSTFVFRTAEHGHDFFDFVSGRREPPEGMGAGLVYSRFNHPNSEIVEDRLRLFGRAREREWLASAVRHTAGRGDGKPNTFDAVQQRRGTVSAGFA